MFVTNSGSSRVLNLKTALSVPWEGVGHRSTDSPTLGLASSRCSRTLIAVSTSMLSRIRHILLITLFAAAHLLGQPLASSSWCQSKSEGVASCCCAAMAGPSECGGCCSTGSDQDDQGPGSPEDESYKSGCHCTVTPPMPLPQHQNDSVLAQLLGVDALARADENPTLSSVWPSLASRAARPPNPPPRVVRKTSPVFTQAFRL